MIQIKKNEEVIEIPHIEHMVHHKNLKSILNNGLLSHNEAYGKGLITTDISMAEVQTRRDKKDIQVGARVLNLHDFVSFYFNSRNAMLYTKKVGHTQDEIVILLCLADILDTKMDDKKFAIFSEGNAASNDTKFYSGKSQLVNIDLGLLRSGSWNSNDEALKSEQKRKMCAEVLVYPSVSPSEICWIICPNKTMLAYCNEQLSLVPETSHIKAIVDTTYFF